MTDSAADLSKRRSVVYNIRIADDPKHNARFAVVCPRHKLVRDDLTITEARLLLADHIRDER